MSENERLVLVIDEYPYLAKASKSISSRLQHIIDHTWKNGQIFLILFGSSMSFMEQQAFVYGINGGIPHYINKLAIENDVDIALKDNLFNTSSYLFEEPENKGIVGFRYFDN